MATQVRHGRVRRGVGGSSNTSVEVLLAETVPSLGQQGEIVRVKPGYARNYLLPHGLATVATDNNKKMVELHKVKLAACALVRRPFHPPLYVLLTRLIPPPPAKPIA